MRVSKLKEIMALQLGALREALIEAGASENKAAAAAEEVATYERDMADLRSDIRLIKWSQGLIIAGILALILKAFV